MPWLESAAAVNCEVSSPGSVVVAAGHMSSPRKLEALELPEPPAARAVKYVLPSSSRPVNSSTAARMGGVPPAEAPMYWWIRPTEPVICHCSLGEVDSMNPMNISTAPTSSLR